MKAIKKINNNIAVCLDADNHQLIAVGKGLGFPKMPYEITDLKRIQRTFYNVDSMYVDMASEIPSDILSIAAEIVDLFRLKVPTPITSNLVFTLADHIKFAIERRKKGMVFTAPMQYDIENLYTDEFEMGKKALGIINNKLHANLPSEEASNLAIHFINARNMSTKPNGNEGESDLISDITDIISGYFEIYIDKHSFSYSRFVTHMQYLLKRQTEGISIHSGNKVMYEDMVNNYPKTADCVKKISKYLAEQRGINLEDEEKFYLMLHVNRLCSREGL